VDILTRAARRRATCCLPPLSRETVSEVADLALGLLFPELAADPGPDSAATELATLERRLTRLSRAETTAAFVAALPAIGDLLDADAAALEAFDPAAVSLTEVIAAYPGFYAVAHHRLAHVLHPTDPLLARLISERAHGRTGVDIHPGARIGRSFAIDHGTGVVIGATAVLGSNVRLFQGVTLGSVRVTKALAGVKRHPTVEDDVTIYANATILGGETVIGAGSVIGANVWLTRSVPPGSVVTAAQAVASGDAAFGG
jgi:serine O-acetyltransferase